MEKKKESFKDYIERVVRSKVPQEIKPNSMTTPINNLKIFFRPNNYRRKIIINPLTNSTIKNINSAIGKLFLKKDFKQAEHSKLIFIKNFNGITLQIGKKSITGIYSQRIIEGQKQVFMIHAETMEQLQERIDKRKNKIRSAIDSAILLFCKETDIDIIERPIWDRYEDFIKGEEYIDNIPAACIIHDTFFKKVYGEGIEMKQTENKEPPTVHIKNYIKNRAIEDISPVIAEELAIVREMTKEAISLNTSTSKLLNESIRQDMRNQSDLLEFKADIRVHNKVLKGIDFSFKKFNRLLSQKKLSDY